MGGSPSIVMSKFEDSQASLVGENSWLKIGICTDTAARFHKLDINARLDTGVSILDQEKDIVLVSGYSFDHSSIPVIEDDESNMSNVYRFSFGMKDEICRFCEQSGTSYYKIGILY
jgi:hypothetical protein